MQSSTKRKVNQNMNGSVDPGFFIERLSTAEYKASSGLKNLDKRKATIDVVSNLRLVIGRFRSDLLLHYRHELERKPYRQPFGYA